jgi:hypothetical protein
MDGCQEAIVEKFGIYIPQSFSKSVENYKNNISWL